MVDDFLNPCCRVLGSSQVSFWFPAGKASVSCRVRDGFPYCYQNWSLRTVYYIVEFWLISVISIACFGLALFEGWRLPVSPLDGRSCVCPWVVFAATSALVTLIGLPYCRTLHHLLFPHTSCCGYYT